MSEIKSVFIFCGGVQDLRDIVSKIVWSVHVYFSLHSSFTPLN